MGYLQSFGGDRLETDLNPKPNFTRMFIVLNELCRIDALIQLGYLHVDDGVFSSAIPLTQRERLLARLEQFLSFLFQEFKSFRSDIIIHPKGQ